MAEVKNAFIKSKMNQDLDDRLIPSGEYREGFNIQVSKSQGEDVGALENVLGNQDLIDFEALTTTGIQVIGQFTNPSKNTIYFFLTNYTDLNYITNPTYDPTKFNYIYEYNVLNGDSVRLAEGAFLNFSTTNPIYGVNMVENILFFTDNRNQPRRIDITRRNASGGVFYTNEDSVSVAQYNPFDPILVYKDSTTQGAAAAPETTMYDVVSEFLPDNSTENPYYNASYAGDPDYLENKFIRFSYRFRFNSGEYSLLAPFTQALFIPQQDGYFLEGDEESAYRSTIVKFMQNKVNRILLQIPIPSADGATFVENFNIDEIDVVFKESDGQALYVVDTIPASTISMTTGNYVEYDYQAKKPFKTLPDSTLIRVYDKVPVKALSQEIIGNRVVYGNYQDKHTPPKSLVYDVGISSKSNFNDDDDPNIGRVENTTSIVEYPNHNLKQNRNYQVGVVLSDRYGRTSTVILSTTTEGQDVNAVLFGASTVYNPYRLGLLGETTVYAASVKDWPGDSLKIRFDQAIQSTKSIVTGAPGLYNGDPSSADYNPLGWYSYKIVVKQLEQEYYNVYLGGILNGYPSAPASPPDPQNSTAFITLINDNINKVPRDLNEVGPDQKQYRSSVQLFGRVTPDRSTSPTYNQQFYPGQIDSVTTPAVESITILPSSDTVNTIAEEENIVTSGATIVDLYQTDSNPYIARITQGNEQNPIGSLPVASGSYNFLLGVYETEPVTSRLEIFWETSTTGLISDLNEAIRTGTNETVGLVYFEWDLDEATEIGTSIAGRFAPIDEEGNNQLPKEPLEESDLSMSVTDIDGNDITKFSLRKIPKTAQSVYDPLDKDTFDTYEIDTTEEFYYGPDAAVNQVFYFTFTDDTTGENVADVVESLSNVAPTITNGTTVSFDADDTGVIFTYEAINGTVDTTRNTLNLTWSMEGNPPELTLDANTGELSVSDSLAGKITLTITVQDAGGLTDTITSELVAGEIPVNEGFGSGSALMSGGSGWSGAHYWSSGDNNSTASTPLPGEFTGTVDIRTPYPGLSLTSTKENSGFVTAPDCDGYTFYNENHKSLGTDNPSSGLSGGLTQGTGFIALDVLGEQYDFSVNNSLTTYPFILYPTYLQYRNPTGAGYPNNWEIAKDIEGKEIKFGGTQNNWDSISVDPYGAIQATGVITNDDSARDYDNREINEFPTTDTNIDSEDCMQASLQPPVTGTSNRFRVAARRVFVIGKSQQEAYTNPPEYYGDYRLVVRYPWGLSVADGPSGYGEDIVVGYGTESCPVDPQYKNAQMNWRSVLRYGDLYYPPYSRSTPKSYSYQVSTLTGADAIIATGLPTSKNLFAREWAMRYVSRFYEDAELTIPWESGSSGFQGAGWYGFRSVGANFDVNVKYGTDNSFPKFGTTSATGSQSIDFRQTDQDRKWAVYLDNNGIKVLTDVESQTTVQPGVAPNSPQFPPG